MTSPLQRLMVSLQVSTHHHGRIDCESRRVVAPPCPRSTELLQRSPVGRVESFPSWLSQLFRGRPGGRRHVRSGGRLCDTLMWSRRAMFAGVSSSSRATCPDTEMHRWDRRWDSEVRPVPCSTSSFRTRSNHRIPISCLRHFWWKTSRVLTSADSKVQMSAAYSSNTDKTMVYTELGQLTCVLTSCLGLAHCCCRQALYHQF